MATEAEMTELVAAVRAIAERNNRQPKRNPSDYYTAHQDGAAPFIDVGVTLDEVAGWDALDYRNREPLVPWDSAKTRRVADAAWKAGLLYRYTKPHAARYRYAYVLPELHDAVQAERALSDGERAQRSLDGARERVARQQAQHVPERSSDEVPSWMTFREPYAARALVGMGEIVPVGEDWERRKLYALAEHAPQYLEAVERRDLNRRLLDERAARAKDTLTEVAAGNPARVANNQRQVTLSLGDAEAIVAVLAELVEEIEPGLWATIEAKLEAAK